MKSPKLYPLKFVPQLKVKVWGGEALREQLGKQGNGQLGESWELSGVKNNISVVSNGVFKGKSLTALIKEYGKELMGQTVINQFGFDFPLLFKFIHAREDLSVQLHPNDEVAATRHNSFGKSEMWYVLDSEEEAQLIVGFDGDIEMKEYQKHLSEGTLTQILHSEKIKPGDAFFIKPGTVHAIGAGVLLAEIQQTSDITYRIYDWDRPGLDGKMRELHTQEALDVIDFRSKNSKLDFDSRLNDPFEICRSDYFVTNGLVLTEPLTRDLSTMDSFVVYMCIEGTTQISCDLGSLELDKGETALIPACADSIELSCTDCSLLEVYVPANG